MKKLLKRVKRKEKDLINKIKEIGAPTVFYIEFSNHVIADSIAESTGVGTAQFNTCHNVSKKQLDERATYLSLMEENYRTMEKYIVGSDKENRLNY